MRLVGTGLLALGLHAAVGYGAHEIAKRVEFPLRAKVIPLVDKAMMQEILERIAQLEDDKPDDELVEVDLRELEELEELVETMPEPESREVASLEASYDDSAYVEQKAREAEGEMGNPDAQESGNRYAVKGPEDNLDPHIARQAALRDAAEFGMIGLLNSGAGGDPDAPTAPWGRDDALGNDPLSARGNKWGDSIGDSFGRGGLGLRGIGEGGGGRGEGVGLGSIGTLGHGAGTGTGQGFGSGHGRLGRSHRAPPPRVKMGSTTVSGGLPPEVIQRIVRSSFGRFRACYDAGLRNDPNLSGNVRVRFTISASGSVKKASASGSIPDEKVISCVQRAFNSLSFPQPEGGEVSVTYPIVFSSSGDSGDRSSAPPASKPRSDAPRESPPPAAKAKSRVNASVKSVSVSGGLDETAVKKKLKRKRSSFRACHRSAGVTGGGSVSLRFQVNAAGSAVIGKRSEAIVSAFDDGVAACALSAISGLTFPKPRDGSATVSFRIVFGD